MDGLLAVCHAIALSGNHHCCCPVGGHNALSADSLFEPDVILRVGEGDGAFNFGVHSFMLKGRGIDFIDGALNFGSEGGGGSGEPIVISAGNLNPGIVYALLRWLYTGDAISGVCCQQQCYAHMYRLTVLQLSQDRKHGGTHYSSCTCCPYCQDQGLPAHHQQQLLNGLMVVFNCPRSVFALQTNCQRTG